jgi:hypothetical protein
MLVDGAENIEAFLKNWAVAKRSLMPNAEFIFDEWLLEHGETFGPVIKRPKGVRLGKMKECYSNSAKALLFYLVDDTEWFYTEGVVFRKDLPIQLDHAWLSNRKGEVLDLTLRDQDGEDQYFGIPFTREYAIQKIMDHKYYGLFSNGMMYNRDVMDTVDEGRAWKKGERDA